MTLEISLYWTEKKIEICNRLFKFYLNLNTRESNEKQIEINVK